MPLTTLYAVDNNMRLTFNDIPADISLADMCLNEDEAEPVFLAGAVHINGWRLVLYFPDTEFHTFFSGQVPISSDIHVVRTFPDMSGALPSCRS